MRLLASGYPIYPDDLKKLLKPSLMLETPLALIMLIPADPRKDMCHG
jgi:hypothetical protein